MTRGATINRVSATKAALTLLGAGVLVLALTLAMAVVGPAAPAAAAPVGIDLYATAGSTTLPGGQTVPVWGYTTNGGSISKPGGPTLSVTEGDTVTLTLHNGLAESSGLLLQGQAMVPDRTGVGPGGTRSYTFTATAPGTYLYEAALLPNAEHQIAMGLYGALVVQPAGGGRAYDDPGSAYQEQAVLVLSEIDPALNTRADKTTFDMRAFAPRYYLVNGLASPAATPIPTTGGHTVLLRYVNAGTTYHSMGILGARQRVIALDGSRLQYDHSYVAETFGPGQTADALVTAPDAATATALSVYDSSLQLHNGTAAGLGGMLTSIAVAADLASGGDTTGPITTAVAFAGGNVTATVDDSARGNATVQAAEYFLDVVGAAGSGAALSAVAAPFDAPNEAVTAAASVPSGEHVLYVHGKDAVGNWGPLSSALVTGGDSAGPVTRSAVLTPGLTSHLNAAGIAVSATADDGASGRSAITAAEYSIDGGTAAAMAVSPPSATLASVDATIPAGVVNALPEGIHHVAVRSQDAAGNWGAPVTVDLTVDITAPTASGVSVSPTPNNGTLAVTASTPAVRVSATSLSDPVSASVNSPLFAGEVFIDTVGANGSGIPLNATDGVYNSASEAAYADIPLATVRAMSNGPHTLSVHAKDSAGNWGGFTTTILLVDKNGPVVSAVSATPTPTQGATSVTLTATATDDLTAITRAEYFTGTDPGFGNATPMTLAGPGPGPVTVSASIDTSRLAEGTYRYLLRAKDSAGNWGTTTAVTVTVTAPLQFSTVGNTNPPGVAGTADDADIYGWSGTAFSRAIDMSLAPYSVPTAANVDGFDRVSPSQFYVSFSTTTTLPGVGTVQDEDVLFWTGTAWQMFFDGSVHGVTTNLDAISVSGSTLYFSTATNTNPPGVGGTADDADVYRWNGASSYTRVWDASANGLAAGANVDGLSYRTVGHFYLSFSATTTAVPGLGTVQDEDVVYDNGGTWVTYFDGTAHGLTTDNLDVDAFDVP